jgi:hypothetical protein
MIKMQKLLNKRKQQNVKLLKLRKMRDITKCFLICFWNGEISNCYMLFILLCTYLQERSLKQHVQDEMEKVVKSNGTSLSTCATYDYSLFSKSLMFCYCNGWPWFSFNIVGNQCCEEARMETEYLDSNGKAFWKLRSYNDGYAFL